jgi:hypothetical protein
MEKMRDNLASFSDRIINEKLLEKTTRSKQFEITNTHGLVSNYLFLQLFTHL